MENSTKQCRKCGEIKDRASGFYFRPNGHIISPCKACCYVNTKQWCNDNPDKRNALKKVHRNTEGAKQTHRDYLQKWNISHAESIAQRNRQWIANHRVRVNISNRASQIVSAAIKKGLLTRPSSCESCGQFHKRIEAAHHDYSKPLDIRWLCKPCHSKWDAAQPKTTGEGMCGV